MNVTIAEERPISLRRHRLTVDDFHRMGEVGLLTEDDRIELVEGELIDMAPIGPKHADLTNYLLRLFARQLAEDKMVAVQNPVRFARYCELYPDLAIVRNRRYSTAHPGPQDVYLIVEIADTTLAYDRGTKLPLYAAHRIPEVWIIDVGENRIEIYGEPDAEARRYLVGAQIKEGVLSSALIPEVKLVLGELFSGDTEVK